MTPEPGDICGSPNCAACWKTRHFGHDVGWRHEDGSLYSATCRDCGETYQRGPVETAAAGEAVEATMVGFDTTSDGRLLLEFQVPQDTRAKLSSRWLLTRAPEEAVPTAREGDCDPEDYCHRCGRPNICWHAPNDTWNAGVGTPEDTRGNTLILCPVCFVQQYEQRHGEPIWTLTAREGGEAEVSSPVRVDGELVLPPNPFGTSATWADYDWRAMSRGEEREGDKVAARLCEMIADAVEASS